MSETVAEILLAHRSGKMRPQDTVERSLQRLRASGDTAIFISVDEAGARRAAAELSLSDSSLPLFGVPVAVKDNIDVAGLPTTAACPAFSYTPKQDSTAVARLRKAGAIILGKTNLDQFATGLVGVRSPYGVPRNPINPALIPGGSSSGSGAAVSAGIVPLALGTDTAGSGRVPASLTNIAGLKPSVGLIPATGVVPACRSLDCVSVFALTTDDAFHALRIMAGPDPGDPYSRVLPLATLTPISAPRLGVPRAADRIFFDARAAQAFDAALRLAKDSGAKLVEIDLTPFLETARLLYHGPWVAERYAAVGEFIDAHLDKVHPVTRAIISSGKAVSAVDTFRAFYRLAALQAQARAAFAQIDALMLPTIPAAYTVAEVEADPVELNTRLGTYTNFVNLLDLCGMAVPACFAADGTPFGVTFLAPAGQDAIAASIARQFHARTSLPLGAIRHPQSPLPHMVTSTEGEEFAVAVVGAHLSGMPLNHELRALHGRLLETTVTAPDYRLFALAGTQPPKPGLLRVPAGTGEAIAIEIWALNAAAFGRFVASVTPPLCIGTLRLTDGRQVKGFLVEAEAVKGARDISHFGGWRAFLQSTEVPA